ncbi:hypothetical protein TcBrA4_0000060 [Trypanosoma cruzi]|nr:hypothetical protein TcBrA4_0000060 [Trypanosoma cruzi]
MALRAPRRCGNLTFPVTRNGQECRRNHHPPVERGRERETARRTAPSATDCTAQAEATFVLFPHGRRGKASRSRTLSSALPQARLLRVKKKASRDMAILLHPSRSQCTSCGFRSETKASPVSYLRAHERSKTELQPATKTTALPSMPLTWQAAGIAEVLASHTRHKHPDSKNVTTPKMAPQCTHSAKLETQQEERQLRTATLPPQEIPSAAQENAGEGRRTVRQGSTHTSIHQRPLPPLNGNRGVMLPIRRTLPGDGTPMGSHRSNFAVQHAAFSPAKVTEWAGIARHTTGIDRYIVKYNQREMCDETLPHLLCCPAL